MTLRRISYTSLITIRSLGTPPPHTRVDGGPKRHYYEYTIINVTHRERRPLGALILLHGKLSTKVRNAVEDANSIAFSVALGQTNDQTIQRVAADISAAHEGYLEYKDHFLRGKRDDDDQFVEGSVSGRATFKFKKPPGMVRHIDTIRTAVLVNGTVQATPSVPHDACDATETSNCKRTKHNNAKHPSSVTLCLSTCETSPWGISDLGAPPPC